MNHTTAFVGCAHVHTPSFVRKVSDRKDVKVKAIWDHDAERAERTAAELSAERVADPEVIWRDETIDSVVICSETNRHRELAEAAATAKKHLFVEKPLGMGAADAFAIARAIERAGVMFQTGYFMRGMPVHRFLRDQVHKGTFGTVTRVRHTNFHGASLIDRFTPQWLWMTLREEAGIGAFGDLGTHSLDIVMWLFGDVALVTATLASVTGRYGDLDETGEALLRFENGVIGSLGGGWVDIAHPVSLIISGTEGHAHVARDKLYLKSDRIEGADGETPWTSLPAAQPHAFDLFFDACLSGDGTLLVSPREAAHRSAVMEAMYSAAAKQSWVAPQRDA